MGGHGPARGAVTVGHWGRDQGHRRRRRHIYALLFSNGCCYIGQSVDPEQRARQHRGPQGGWRFPFELVLLEEVVDTRLACEEHEYAWRLVAQRAGWRIYGRPPDVLVDPRRRTTPQRLALAQTLQWPPAHVRVSWWVRSACGLGALAGAWAVALVW